jgi:hypothetical protein
MDRRYGEGRHYRREAEDQDRRAAGERQRNPVETGRQRDDEHAHLHRRG